MMKCVIVDDEPLALAQMQEYVSRIPFLECVAQCSNATEADIALKSDKVDVIFIDINMPGMNGLQFVQNLQNPPKVVFTTAYSEYAVDGFKLSAAGYLLKPFEFEEFAEVAKKVYKWHQMECMAENNSLTIDEDEPAIFVKADYKVLRVPINSIRYVESMSEYVRIFIDGESRPIVTLLSMKKMEESLPNTFMRVHRSYIVNLCKVKEVSRMRIVYDGNTYVPIGDMYKERFFDYIDKYFIGKR